MNLLFLHGPPAAGKYTVGRELAALTGAELYHNHLVVDAVLAQHEFGSPGFVALRDKMWREHLGRAVREGAADVIFTFNPENTVPQAFIDWLFDELPNGGARLFSVELAANESDIESRLASAQRRDFRKLTDLPLYRRLRDAGTFQTPVIPRTDLRIDTGKVRPAEAARLVVAHFGLKRN